MDDAARADAGALAHGRKCASLPLTGGLLAVRQARTLVLARCRAAGLGSALREDAALLVSDVVTDAVLRAPGAGRLTVSTSPTCLHVEVTDTRPVSRLDRLRPGRVLTGRTLLLAALAADWGVRASASGTLVWFDVVDGAPA